MSASQIYLNKRFDPEQLKESFCRVKELRSVPVGYPGDGSVNWNAITIFSIGSNDNQLLQLPYLGEALLNLNLSLRLVRFMTLAPGGIIKKHTDTFLSDHIFRLHVPVITNPQVEFTLNDERCFWKEGELWYGDFTKTHYGINKSGEERVHLVLDVNVDDNLLLLFPEEFRAVLKDKTAGKELLKTEALKRFECGFILPKGFSMPGVEFQQLDENFKGYITLLGEDLCLYVNEQPMLKLMPVSEDTLALQGLDFDANVDYVFDGGSIKRLYLNMGGMKIPIETTEYKPV